MEAQKPQSRRNLAHLSRGAGLAVKPSGRCPKRLSFGTVAFVFSIAQQQFMFDFEMSPLFAIFCETRPLGKDGSG